jgi:hypothetical protein
VGYTAFSELCKDLHGVIDVLWLSGTRKCHPWPRHIQQVLT